MQRRKHQRFEVQLPISFKSDTAAGNGMVENLSLEGCLVKSDVSPKEGSYLDLNLHLADHNPPMQVKSAAVRWVSGCLFGVQFLYMTQDAHARLECLIDTLQSRQSQS